MIQLARLFVCLFILGLAAGCGAAGGGNKIPAEVQLALDQSSSFQLYSLDPEPSAASNKPGDVAPELMHSWAVLGSTKITAAQDRSDLMAALKKGVAENKGIAAGCFNPRHAVRVEHDDKVYDIVICFECLSASVYSDGQRSGSFLLSKSPQSTFDEVLIKADVPLPKK